MIFSSIIRYFIPKDPLQGGTDEYYRANILVISCLAAGVLISPFLVIHYTIRGYADPLFFMVLLAILVALTAPFICRWTGSVVAAGVYVTFTETVILAVFNVFDGGFYSASIMWVPVLPLFTVFFAGRRYGAIIATALLAGLVALYFGHQMDLLPPTQKENEPGDLIFFISTSVVLVLMILIAFLYLDWQDVVKSKLREANHAKSNFLSNMSHELRTPLHAIIGFSQVLSQGIAGDLQPKQKEYAGHIDSAGQHLLDLINDILDLAKIESGTSELKLEEVDLKAMLESSVMLFRDSMQQNNIHFEGVYDDSLSDVTVRLDTRKIKQVLYNLLSNAVKFTHRNGTISLESAVRNGNICISIADDGVGIESDHLELIFDNFFQVRHEVDMKTPGTGLGLALSRQFVTMHGGTLRAKSAGEGKGASFLIEIPIQRP